MATDEPAVTCAGLVKVYRSATGETHALRGVDLTVLPGSFTVVAGPSGSGKSSLVGLLAGRDRPSAGDVQVLGTDLATASAGRLRELRRRRIGYVAQRSSEALFPHLSASDQLREAAVVRGSDPAQVGGVLERLGLLRIADRVPAGCSGGEQQRLAVAAAALGAPPLIVADEPTAELDHHHAGLVLDLLRDVTDSGSAVVVTSHDVRVIERADRVVRLRHGVLSSEHDAGGTLAAVIDSTGRVQLPPEVLELFPLLRVEIELDGDRVTLRPPSRSDAPEELP